MTTTIANGVYFLHPAGSCWVAAKFRGGKLVATTEEANAATHAAANDSWGGVVPGDDDVELGREETEAVVREVMGDKVDCEMVVVTRQCD